MTAPCALCHHPAGQHHGPDRQCRWVDGRLACICRQYQAPGEAA